jgi:hypothetical protein
MISKVMNDPKITMYGADQWGISDDVTKPYVVAKIEL